MDTGPICVPPPPPDPAIISFDLDPVARTATMTLSPNSAIDTRIDLTNLDSGEGISAPVGADGSAGPTARFAAEDGDFIELRWGDDNCRQGLCVELHDGPSSSDFACD